MAMAASFSSASCSSQPYTAKPQVRHSLVSTTGGITGSFAAPNRRFGLEFARAQILPFRARRQIDLPFESGASPPELYVEEVERVVKITFPDSERIRYLGDSTWRATLKPISFFHLSATPACVMRVFHEDAALKIASNKLVLDFKGVPVQFEHLDFDFSLIGGLTVGDGGAAALQQRRQNKSFQGWVNLGLKVDMPLPFSMMPDSILMPVGNVILDRILGAMESAILAGILQDYKKWCRKQADEPVPSLSPDVAAISLQ